MAGIVIGVAIVVVLVVAARVLYSWNDSRRARVFEEHLDDNYEAITEHRIRRNFMQGG
ncbi:MAG: hypothetical protein GWP04_12315 [Gammaproteobacteria bacterium]|nr:hypothetical protein [Gammaproteobacteria bacterium]